MGIVWRWNCCCSELASRASPPSSNRFQLFTFWFQFQTQSDRSCYSAYLREAPFWNVLFPWAMSIARKGGLGVKACQDGLEHFSPRLPIWQRGEGGPKLSGQCPYRNNKKLPSVTQMKVGTPYWNPEMLNRFVKSHRIICWQVLSFLNKGQRTKEVFSAKSFHLLVCIFRYGSKQPSWILWQGALSCIVLTLAPVTLTDWDRGVGLWAGYFWRARWQIDCNNNQWLAFRPENTTNETILV